MCGWMLPHSQEERRSANPNEIPGKSPGAGELPKLIIEFTPGEFVFEGVLSPKKHGE